MAGAPRPHSVGANRTHCGDTRPLLLVHGIERTAVWRSVHVRFLVLQIVHKGVLIYWHKIFLSQNRDANSSFERDRLRQLPVSHVWNGHWWVQLDDVTMTSYSVVTSSRVVVVAGRLRVSMVDYTTTQRTQQVLFDKSGSQGNRWFWANSRIRFRFAQGSVSDHLFCNFARWQASAIYTL